MGDGLISIFGMNKLDSRHRGVIRKIRHNPSPVTRVDGWEPKNTAKNESNPFPGLVDAATLSPRVVAVARRERLTRHELTAEVSRAVPACLCLSTELEKVGCVCASAQREDADEAAAPLPGAVAGLLTARAALRLT
jgi:hypothetical protein